MKTATNTNAIKAGEELAISLKIDMKKFNPWTGGRRWGADGLMAFDTNCGDLVYLNREQVRVLVDYLDYYENAAAVRSADCNL